MNANYEPTFGVQFHALGGARGDARQSRLLKHAGRHAALMLQRCTQNDLARGVGSASARRLEEVAPCLRERLRYAFWRRLFVPAKTTTYRLEPWKLQLAGMSPIGVQNPAGSYSHMPVPFTIHFLTTKPASACTSDRIRSRAYTPIQPTRYARQSLGLLGYFQDGDSIFRLD